MDCLFCKIAMGEINSQKVYEDDYILGFKDINPIAPVHILIIPKVHIESMNDVNEENIEYVKDIMLSIKKIAKICGVDENGYRIVSNIGKDGGQEVKHLHFHLIGGKTLGTNL